MELKPLMLMTATLGGTDAVGATARGTRAIAEVTGGEFEGDRLKGKVLTPGGDWAVVDADGLIHLDVRLTLQTDDDANIFMYYTGILEMNEAAQKAMGGGGETQFGDHRFFTQPRFECGHEKYTWLNSVVAVAEGRLIPGAVQYQVYELT